MIKLRINPLVVTDLQEIRNFIAEDNVENATKTLEELYEKFIELSIDIKISRRFLIDNEKHPAGCFFLMQVMAIVVTLLLATLINLVAYEMLVL